MSWVGRFALFAAVVVGWIVFSFTGRAFSLPPTSLSTISLLQQDSPMTSLLTVLVAMVVSALAGTALAGWVRPQAGLFAATMGMAVLSLRGGRLRETLLVAQGPRAYQQLLIELFCLIAMLIFVDRMIALMRPSKLLVNEELADGFTTPATGLAARLTALLAAVGIMAVLMLILCQTDEKAQALASVGIAGFLASLAGHQLSPVRPVWWFLAAPLLVGCTGYALAFLGQYPGWEIGQNRGLFAALSRPLPLDYVSLGVASSLAGYWFSRAVHANSDSEE